MHAIFAFLATRSAALFAGAALYINVVEHAARMGLDVASAAAQWAPSYQRAIWLQAPLAINRLGLPTPQAAGNRTQ